MELIDIYGDTDREELLSFLVEDHQDIAKCASKLIARLSKVCAVESVGQRWGVTFSVSENGTSVAIGSPFGEAWADLKLGIEGDQLLGFWDIRKKTVDAHGEERSSVVSTIRFTKNGTYLLGSSGESALSVQQQNFGQDITAHKIMSSILYAIGAR